MKPVNIKREVNDDLVERLEVLLDSAKAGELKSVAYAGVLFDGSRIRAWYNESDTFLLVGSMQILMHEFINNEVEGVIDHD